MKAKSELTGYKAKVGGITVVSMPEMCCTACGETLPNNVIQLRLKPSTRERARAIDLRRRPYKGWTLKDGDFKGDLFTLVYTGEKRIGDAMEELLELLQTSEITPGLDYVSEYSDEVEEWASKPVPKAPLARRYMGVFSKGIGCGRCNRSWEQCGGFHSTMYEDGSGISHLCEPCWKELTPEETLTFYARLIRDYWDDDTKWPLIKEATLEGK